MHRHVGRLQRSLTPHRSLHTVACWATESGKCVKDVMTVSLLGQYRGRVAAHFPTAICKEKCCVLFMLPKDALMGGRWAQGLWRHKNLTVLTCPGNDVESLILRCLSIEPLIVVFNYSVYPWVHVTFLPLEGCKLFLRRDWKPLEFSLSFTSMEKGQTIFSSPPACIWSNCINISGIFA